MFAMKEKNSDGIKTIMAIKYAAKMHKLRLCQGDSQRACAKYVIASACALCAMRICVLAWNWLVKEDDTNTTAGEQCKLLAQCKHKTKPRKECAPNIWFSEINNNICIITFSAAVGIATASRFNLDRVSCISLNTGLWNFHFYSIPMAGNAQNGLTSRFFLVDKERTHPHTHKIPQCVYLQHKGLSLSFYHHYCFVRIGAAYENTILCCSYIYCLSRISRRKM